VAVQLLASTGTAAQGTSEPALKALFLFNFVKFTEWPVEARSPNSVLRMCVLLHRMIMGWLRLGLLLKAG
jgi:hypothetical protein